jgi:hypothetical protein
MRSVLWTAVAVLACVPAGAGVDVKRQGDHVEVRATAAPVAEVLDKLAHATGMKVVYEGAPPRQLLTAVVADRTPAEAVLALLEGLGLNYALVMDAGGRRVETLLMTSGGNVAAAAQNFNQPQPRSMGAFAARPPEGQMPMPVVPAPEEPADDAVGEADTEDGGGEAPAAAGQDAAAAAGTAVPGAAEQSPAAWREVPMPPVAGGPPPFQPVPPARTPFTPPTTTPAQPPKQ